MSVLAFALFLGAAILVSACIASLVILAQAQAFLDLAKCHLQDAKVTLNDARRLRDEARP